MQTSINGRNFIKGEEGLRLAPYNDAGNQAIGYGHNIRPGEEWMLAGITEAQADQILQGDLERFEAAVNRCVTANVTQNQFDAMVSLAYNIGTGGFCGSTVVREINRGNCVAAANAFRLWRMSEGRVLQVLVDRRERERAIFIQDCSGATPEQINDGYDADTGRTPNSTTPQSTSGPGNTNSAPADVSGNKNVQRMGDVNSGGGVVTSVPQTSVYVNGVLAAVDGSTVTHTNTTTRTANGNPKVKVEGKKLNRKGDRDENGFTRQGGSPNVFTG